MTRVAWGVPAERTYESGVDRGVLYVNRDAGVAWNGLVNVTEVSKGGEAKPAYLDGVKYRNVASSEEFEATIEAFSAPTDFGLCDGQVNVANGLIATRQRRRSFCLTYRTKVGSAADQNLGYKIHLIYNALAAPAEHMHSTLSDSNEASTLSWSITTQPPYLMGYKPTAHFIIDSRYTPDFILEAIEDILYGSESAQARIPDIEELATLFGYSENLIVTILPGGGEYRAQGTAVTLDLDGVFEIDHSRVVVNGDGSFTIL